MKKKKRRGGLPHYREVASDKIHTIICCCLICGSPTGKTQDWRESDLKPKEAFKSDDPKDWQFRHGLCQSCQSQKDEGCVLMYSDTRGCILNPSAAKKLKPEFRDKIIRIPEAEMDKILGPGPSPAGKNTIETN